ncbi:ubiquinol oxidase subunit II [Paenibacillus lignilyticus]|uniref:Quinol oxidase subunit 2 n=1 Tax=Paenibacillus lignilyticus TaxID=1172615 RepID=A0ABS5C8S2_9BACL|nr:ubiquinol oxidase subunit II [Paenibacillus lignilyticus]MBP3961835.1 ubiquinol oxidase subunit II [Paenibacillus lignilyticus]MBP3963494.1 ubiquinol oxidase subunit II [Paenibacillus lignilyticus]
MNISKLTRLLTTSGVLASTAMFVSGCKSMIVFDPKGPIGIHQRDLIYITMLLCLILLVPVLIIAAWIVWRFRDKKGNNAPYQPIWSHSTKLEIIWWSIPILVILILAIVTARYTYMLDPAKPITSDKKAITIQVTSLDWKWLFQYPDQGIATVNHLVIPEGTPIKFELTSDGPMNGFWVPQLGGMIYTMSGMATTMYLQADEPGNYMGTGSNFTGRDFAKMGFKTKAVPQAEFDQWVAESKAGGNALSEEGYQNLAKPGTSGPMTFASIPPGLFERIVHVYSMSRGAPPGYTQKAQTLSGEKSTEHSEGGQLPPGNNAQKDAPDDLESFGSGHANPKLDNMHMNHGK